MSKGAKTILDVGANAGIYSLAALAVQPDADVYAFEPTPEIAKRLHETASLNALDRLHVQQVAVSTRGGTATLRRFRGELGNNEGMNFISQDPCESDEEKVETVSLDQFCRERSIDKIDLLKLDVQGHEFAALRGAERLIRAGSISTIFMELNWAQSPRSPCPASESIRLLSESNYLFSKPTKHLNWQRPGTWLRASTDIVARQTVRVHRAL
jgi:FkbM family methyltransferase